MLSVCLDGLFSSFVKYFIGKIFLVSIIVTLVKRFYYSNAAFFSYFSFYWSFCHCHERILVNFYCSCWQLFLFLCRFCSFVYFVLLNGYMKWCKCILKYCVKTITFLIKIRQKVCNLTYYIYLCKNKIYQALYYFIGLFTTCT